MACRNRDPRGPRSLFLFALLAACGGKPAAPPPPAAGAAAPLVTASRTLSPRRPDGKATFHVETSVAVVPPGVAPSCPGGAAVVAYGAPGAALLRAELPCLASADPASCVEPLPTEVAPGGKVLLGGTPVNGRCVGGAPSAADRYFSAYTDTVVVHLGGGRLLRTIPGSGRIADPADCTKFVKYNLNFTRRSDDCGRTWGSPVALDPLDAGSPFVQGYDRPNLHVDPFTQVGGEPLVYFTGGVISSTTGFLPGGALDRRALLRSHDGGRTWRLAHVFGGGRPLVMLDDAMTSFEDGTLVIFGCVIHDKGAPNNGAPTLFWSYDHGDTFHQATATFPGEPGAPLTCGLLDEPLAPGAIWNRAHFVSLSRVTASKDHPRSHLLRLAYTNVEGPPSAPQEAWRQVLRVLEAEIPRKDRRSAEAAFRPLFVQRGGGPSRSIHQANFVAPDGISGPLTNDGRIPDAGVLWWLEGDHTNSLFSTFYRAVDGSRGYGEVQPAALDPAGRAPRWWRFPAAGRCSPPCWYGDYDHGGYFFDTATRTHRYLMVWSESVPALNERNAFLSFQVVARGAP